jgi:OOP family OmpA-OmpF porin
MARRSTQTFAAAATFLIAALVVTVSPIASPSPAGASGDAAVLGGVQFPGTALSGEDGHFDAANPALDLRGFWSIADTWGVFADALWSPIDGDSLTGDATELGFRIGPELALPIIAEHPFFIAAGAGLLRFSFDPPQGVEMDDATAGFLSVSVGQRIRLTERLRLIWELREDGGVAEIDDGPALHFSTTNLLAGLSWSFGERELDSDGDGVADRRDRCPDTPRGIAVDATGCPRAAEKGAEPDADRDGVADARDRCPETPAGWRVDADGCPVDADGDGVPDGADACASTPRGARVDARGCPLDGDGDGVFDGIDQCPSTPRGVTVDEKGSQELAAPEGKALVLEGV